jgi:hypothetical protein
MPRNLAIPEAYVPTILLLFVAGAALAWVVDRGLARVGLYRLVWHPSLFRASMLVCICTALGLYVYQ